MRYLLIFYLLLSILTICDAGTEGSAAFPYLKTAPDARSAALAESTIATIDDVNAVHWNPSALPLAKGLQFAFTYQSSVFETTYNYLAASYQIKKIGSFGICTKFVSLPDLDGEYDEEGGLISTDKIESSDTAIGISYAREAIPTLLPKLYAGLTVKYISENLADIKGNGIAFDIGTLYQYTDELSFALVQNNIGPQLDFNGTKNPLPSSFKAGAGYKMVLHKPFIKHLRYINLSSSINFPKDNNINGSIGSEFIFTQFIQNMSSALRLGVNVPKEEGFLSMLSFGAGITYKIMGIDYSFISNGSDIGATHRITLLLKTQI